MSKAKIASVYDLTSGKIFNSVEEFHENKRHIYALKTMVDARITARLQKAYFKRDDQRVNNDFGVLYRSDGEWAGQFQIQVLPNDRAQEKFDARWNSKRQPQPV